MSLGVCLPAPCSVKDVKEMMTATMAPNSEHIKLSGLRVRPVPGNYSVFSDPKFHIMA
ncbi:hypothetical protein O3M35_011833 [Rhynocoris fuscipes]|uniref:Nose resistant-to-fluoxetine protein N-terminal domain-containing protein n=1 Tax=Rhynocoris fuscipes TaxID=488301 RepID=A0AAW1D0B1_9HEMI